MKILRSLFLFFLFTFAISAGGVSFAAVAVGEAAPNFTLPDASGETKTLADYQGKYVVLEWTNPDCPFVKKYYGEGHMQQLQERYTQKGVIWLSVASSAPGLQGYYDGPAWQKLTSDHEAKPTAVLLDPSGTVGRLYGAQTTPHMFVINPDGQLVYAGAIDSTPSPHSEDIEDSENYVAKALDEALSGQPVSTPSTKAYGCSVKYAL